MASEVTPDTAVSAPRDRHVSLRPGPAAGRCAAEFIGTFALVFCGPGAAVIDAYTHGGVTPVGIGLSFGLAVGAMIYAIGHISGAHINPAVTLAFTLTRHFPLRDVPGYLGAQLAGAAAASLVTKGLYGNVAHLGATLPGHGAGQALALEGVLSFFLMFVIMAVATDTRAVGEAAAIAIGGYVALAATFAGPIAGASMNPARSFGPALVSNDWTAWWVYWLGPIAGALAGALAYQAIRAGGQRSAAADGGREA
ncbi:MAG TPA: MIP family channel protein [Dehalococcoidia bacterium]|nr:MIP family channel protein [Dehalococcoidia bacterium]